MVTALNAQFGEFGIKYTNTWNLDQSRITGAENSPVFGISYQHETSNNYYVYFELAAVEGATNVSPLWFVETAQFYNAVVSRVGDSKVIASSGAFAEIPTTERAMTLDAYLEFFDGKANN